MTDGNCFTVCSLKCVHFRYVSQDWRKNMSNFRDHFNLHDKRNCVTKDLNTIQSGRGDKRYGLYWLQIIARKLFKFWAETRLMCAQIFITVIPHARRLTRCLPLVENTCITVSRKNWMVTTYYILLLLIEAENENDRH